MPDQAVKTTQARTPLGVWVFVFLAVPLALFCVYFAAVHALILMGEYTEPDVNVEEVSAREVGDLPANQWLEMAAPVAGWIPDWYQAQGQYYLELGVLLEGEQRAAALARSAEYWDGAYELRPGWPYYPLSSLVADSYYDAPAELVQFHMQQLVDLSYNERGVHLRLFDTSFRVWGKLTSDQRRWVLKQAAMPYGQTTRRAFQAAKTYGFKPVLCANLPWNVAKKYCAVKQR